MSMVGLNLLSQPFMMMTTTLNSFQADDHIYLIDGSSFIFRAYHALPPLTRKSDGLPIGAVAGFCNMLWKLLQDLKGEQRPTHLAVIFDTSAKTFRDDFYDQYKSHRPPPPEDLVPQFQIIREAVDAFGVRRIELDGFEADDIIATYCKFAEEVGARVTIVGSDKDLMQLVSEQTLMFDPMKDKLIGIEQVIEKFGVKPERVTDVQALTGDSVDNVPGVPGIGIKTASQLIVEYGSLENLLISTASISQVKRRETLEQNKDKALLSLKLVTLCKDVPFHEDFFSIELHPPSASTLIAFLKGMEFQTLTKRVATAFEADANEIEAAPVAQEFAKHSAQSQSIPNDVLDENELNIANAFETLKTRLANIPFSRIAYEKITTTLQLETWKKHILSTGYFAIDTETTGLDTLKADLVGISLCYAPQKACYIPIAHRGGEQLFDQGLLPEQLTLEEVIAFLKPLLANPSLLKIGQNIKYDLQILRRYGLDIIAYDDTMLMSYALEGGLHGHGMDELSQLHFRHVPLSFKQLTQKGKSQITFDLVPLDEATQYAAEDADVTLRLWQLFRAQLMKDGLNTVYQTLEKPLIEPICAMEGRGIIVDRSVLSKLSHNFGTRLVALEAQIHQLAGEPFNIGSPKQLGSILFEKMNLGQGKKTASGAWSTGADVLEELAAQNHELPQKVLEWRQLSKLKSTYTDALPEHIQPTTGRVHTSFALASTSTGRLSSSEPNLQNIPIRSEEGRSIRTAFIAQDNFKILSADYSQIELRLLAEIADIQSLKDAFQNNLDIHAMTASEMFGIPLNEIDSATRRRAKAINFGIIYGISAFGLANQLGIGREEASQYIKSYFHKFPGIQDYMAQTKKIAHEQGYVETLFGRRCHIARIASSNPTERAFSERQAINAPIQGSAADIIRRAMIQLELGLKEKGMTSKMLLQVHDELLFECPDDELEVAKAYVVKTMENAAMPALYLSVPLKVDARFAQNWDEAH